MKRQDRMSVSILMITFAFVENLTFSINVISFSCISLGIVGWNDACGFGLDVMSFMAHGRRCKNMPFVA